MSAQRLEITPSFGLNGKSESAPSSADFYLPTIKPPYTPQTKRKKTPILRGVHSKKVPLHESGLVDFDGLSMYMHRNPDYVPLYRTPGWKYHHINHPFSSFEQSELDLEDRDWNLIELRRKSYQQVHMRITNEIIYHNVHEISVPHPPRETVAKALKDFERIDMLGAATLFLILSRGSSEFDVDDEAVVPIWMKEIEPKDRISFIEEVREKNAGALASAEILPDRIVTSAIKRLSIHLKGDPYLVNLANRRLESDPVYYPVRVPSHKTLLDKAKRAIALELLAKEDDSSLQTGVDELELKVA